MMCGNKIDLRQSFLDEGKTVITQESGEKLAKVGNISVPYYPYFQMHCEFVRNIVVLPTSDPRSQRP